MLGNTLNTAAGPSCYVFTVLQRTLHTFSRVSSSAGISAVKPDSQYNVIFLFPEIKTILSCYSNGFIQSPYTNPANPSQSTKRCQSLCASVGSAYKMNPECTVSLCMCVCVQTACFYPYIHSFCVCLCDSSCYPHVCHQFPFFCLCLYTLARA